MICKECKSVMKKTKYFGKNAWYCSKCKTGYIEPNKKIYSKCVKCIKQNWCKAYDKTDISLNNCADYINIDNNLVKLFKRDNIFSF